MEFLRAKNYEEMSKLAADVIEKQVTEKSNSVLGLATGSTPEGMYAELAERYRNGKIDFKQVKTVNLDEYKGLDKENDQSYYYYMCHHLFNHVNIDKAHIHLPDGTNENSEEECKRYDRIIEELGNADIQVLGIGPNGHIGFNEPSDKFVKNTNCVELKQSTIDANARFFERMEDVPKFAYTMGLKQIMNAKKVLLLVSGAGKANILKQAIYGEITPNVPASILQFHNNLIVIADEDACGAL